MNSDVVKDAKWIFLSICKLLFQSNFLNIVDDEMIEIYTDMETGIITNVS